MLKALKNIARTDLIRTSFFTSIATLVKIAAAFVLNKVVAVYVGPVGIAVVGQFNNFFGIISTIGTGGINNGVIKYIAENRQSESNTKKIISTAFLFMVFCSLLAAAIIFLFAGYLSNLIFKSQEYKFVLMLVAVSLLFASLNTLLMSVLNGHKEITKYTWANIISSLLILILSVVLGVAYQLQGVLIALVVGQSVVFFITLLFVLNCSWFKINYFFEHFDKEVLRKLSKYSVMTLASASTLPVALLIIRNYIGKNLSWQDAGYWQGVYTISEVYLMFVTSSLSVYYLPRLAEITDKKELRNEIISTGKIVLPIVTVIAAFVYLLKEPLVLLLFTGKFSSMLPLFKFQLLGDVIKVAGFILAYQMLAKSMTIVYVITEIIFSGSFILLSFLLIPIWGLPGVAMAFCANYTLYFLFLVIYFRKQFF